jgi:hypothetical protein
MIERTTVNDRPATIAYINDKFEPVEKDTATLIKVVFDDGEQLILATLRAGGGSDESERKGKTP